MLAPRELLATARERGVAGTGRRTRRGEETELRVRGDQGLTACVGDYQKSQQEPSEVYRGPPSNVQHRAGRHMHAGRSRGSGARPRR